MKEKVKASIIILTYNNLDYTRQCLENIVARTNYPNYEVIIVDNASQDDTPQYLRTFAQEHPNFHPIFNETNTGFAGGNNIGARAASGDYFVFLNNDVIVTANWLQGLLDHLKDLKVGMVGPVTNSSGNETRILVSYQDVVDMPAFADEYTRTHAGQTLEVQMLAFLCVAMRRAVFEEIGDLDERFQRGMFEDDDYAVRVRQKGYKILCAEDVFVHHFGSASFSKLGPGPYWELFKANMAKFEEKWGVTWEPSRLRPSLMGRQMRELIDGFIWYGDAISQLNEGIAERDRNAAQVWNQILERDQIIFEKKQKINELIKQLEASEEYILTLKRSRAWKVMTFLWRLRAALAPPNSLRSQILSACLYPFRSRQEK